MEPRRCASVASDHSDSVTGGHEPQHCSQMPQQMIYNASSQGHPHHVSGNSHMLPQQSCMVVPQQYIAAEQSMHYGQAQAKRTLAVADHPTVSSALTGDVPLHGQPNTQSYPAEVKSHQRHSSSHESAAVYGGMPGPVMTMPGQVHHSPKALHQNMEGMIVSGHVSGGDGHMHHAAGYYPVSHHGQYMQNSGQISWQNQRQYMSPGEQVAVPGQVFVSGGQARFNSQMPMQFRGQHPHYTVNQEYGDVYCSQYNPICGDLNSGVARGSYAPQQHCVGPNGQRIMFARHSMHAPRLYPRMPADAQFVFYAPRAPGGASQQISPSWSGSAPMMRQSVPVVYSNQPAWQRPMAVAYGSPLPGQRMPDYHLSPDTRMNPEFCNSFGGTRQHLSASHSFSPGSVHCYRPPSNQAVRTGMANVDNKYIGACHVQADGNANSMPASWEYASTVDACTTVNTATMCSTADSNICSKDATAVIHTSIPSHPLEHLPDGRQSVSHNMCTAASSQSSYSHPGYYMHGANVNGPWSASATEEYYSYNAVSQYTPHQHASRHGHPYNYYTSPPHAPYSGSPHYPLTRCGHPYPSHAERMQWQGQVAERTLPECNSDLPDEAASQHQMDQESLTTVASTTSSESASVTASVSDSVFSASVAVTSCAVSKQDNADTAHAARTVTMQSAVGQTGCPVSSTGSASPLTTSPNCSNISQAANTTAVNPVVARLASAGASTSAVPLEDGTVLPTVFVPDKCMESVVTVTSGGNESQNSLQVTSSALSSSSKLLKGSKRSASRKGATKTKKKKSGLSLESGKFCINSVRCDSVDSLCSVSDNIHTATPTKTVLGPESVDRLCSVTSSCPEQAAVIVPYGWRRHVDSGTVVYYSPSNVCLRSYDEVRQYLLKEGTCKCGLQCPLVVDKTFVFDAEQKQSKHLFADDIHAASDRSNSLCNHRRKIIAMATFQQSTGFRFAKPEAASVPRLPAPVLYTTAEATVITSVTEVKVASSLPVCDQSSSASTSLTIPPVTHSFSRSTITDSVHDGNSVSNQSTSAIPQSYGGYYVGPGTTSSSGKGGLVPMMHMHYGSSPVFGYSPVAIQPARLPDHPCYHPSTEFQPRMATSFRQMVAVTPHRMPYSTSGYSVYDRSAVNVTGTSLSGNMQLPRGVCGPPLPRAVSTSSHHQAVESPSTVSDVQEPSRPPAPTKSKRKSRAQSKESYSSILDRSVPCPNIDVRQIIQEQRERMQMETASCSSIGGQSSTAAWTMPTLHATSVAMSQQPVMVPSQNLHATSPPVTSSAVSHGMTTASSCYSVTVSNAPVGTITSISISHPQPSSTDISNSSTTISSASVYTVVSCGSSLAFMTASTTRAIITAPMSTSVPSGTSWVYSGAQPCSQYNQWPPYCSHPLSCTKSSAGMSPYLSQFDCSQGRQVSGSLPYPCPQPNLSDAAAVTVAESVVASTAWLPGGKVLPRSTSEASKDESPIRLVQNMVSGLETTQNSLAAMATSLIVGQSDSVPRRRRSGAADASTTSTTTNTELSDEVRLDRKSPNAGISPGLPDDVRCTQAKLATSAVTTITSVLAQVLPAASIVPSVYCTPPLPSSSVSTTVVAAAASVRPCSDAVSVADASTGNDAASVAVSGLGDVDGDADSNSTHCSTSTFDGGTMQLQANSQVIDDDDSTQDCDISIAGTDSGEVLCTTGTQTSTPTAGMSNCNSIESAGDGSESMEPVDTGAPAVSTAGDELQTETGALNVPLPDRKSTRLNSSH